jgi:hypothetical protein
MWERTSGTSCAVARHAESERQAGASWTAGEWQKAAESLKFSRQIIDAGQSLLGTRKTKIFSWTGIVLVV